MPKCVGIATKHEVDHVLGLWPEHQRTDRDMYITYDCSTVAFKSGCNPLLGLNCCDTPEHECCCIDGVHKKFPFDQSLTWTGDYDYDSIMHYASKQNDRGERYVLSRKDNPRRPIGPNENPSLGDGDAICALYPIPCEAYRVTQNRVIISRTSEWSFRI